MTAKEAFAIAKKVNDEAENEEYNAIMALIELAASRGKYIVHSFDPMTMPTLKKLQDSPNNFYVANLSTTTAHYLINWEK